MPSASPSPGTERGDGAATTGRDALEPAARRLDDWPRTRRPLPWLIAAFVAMLFVVPFDSVAIPSGVANLTVDRIALILIVIVWCFAMLGPDGRRPRWRSSPVNVMLGLFVTVAFVSVLASADTLSANDEMAIALKKLALLLSYTAFFVIVASTIRPTEVRSFALFAVVLACITAAGTVYELRSGTNPFFLVADKVFFGPFQVLPDVMGVDAIGRPNVSGPTAHGLAVTTLIAMTLPVALLGLLSTVGWRRVVFVAAVGLMAAGCIATFRKSAIVLPIAVALVFLVYRPWAMLRLWPVGVVIGVIIHFAAPGTLGTSLNALAPSKLFAASSTEGRTKDYAPVMLDIKDRLVIGRGYGTFDPHKYRYLDNQYLMAAVETGLVGLTVYLLLILCVVRLGHRAARSRDPSRAPAGLAAVAVATTFGIGSVVYDEMSFPQVPYMFLAVVAMALVAHGVRTPVAAPRQTLAPANTTLAHA